MKRKILTFTNKFSKGLSRHLEKGTPAKAAASYLQMIKTLVSSEPVIHIDDSDVVKPNGYKFESLGIVRDGSENTSTKNVYKKGYHVTEACALTTSNHPVSIFSRIHSFQFKNFRVRKLCAIIKTANPVKKKVFFCYYRLAKGISGILSYAKEGVRLWFRTKRPTYRQLCLKLVA